MLFQLILLGQEFRAALVGREDGDERGPLVSLDLLLAVQDVDVGRDLEGAVADVAEERRLSVSVRAHQAVPPALRYEQARVAEQVLALGRYAVKIDILSKIDATLFHYQSLTMLRIGNVTPV